MSSSETDDGALVKRRVWANLAAVFFTRAIRGGEQVILVPILLSAWGIQRYGEWIAITSVAQFAYFAQFGFGAAGASDIIMRCAASEIAEANRSLATSLLAVTALIIFFVLAGYTFSEFYDFNNFWQLQSIGPSQAGDIFVLSAFTVMLGFYIAPIAATISVSTGAALPNFVASIVKCLELCAITIALISGGSPVTVAATSFFFGVASVFVQIGLAIYKARWLSLRHLYPSVDAIRRTMSPSIGYFLMLLSMSGLSVYVPRLMIFSVFGATTLSIYSVLVTYTRAARTLTNVIPLATQLELGRLFGAKNFIRFGNLLETSLTYSIWMGVSLMLGAVLIAQWFIPIWTHGKIHAEWSILAFLAIGSIVGTFADAIMFATAGINKVLGISVWYLVSLVVALSAGGVLMFMLGPGAVAAALIVPEGVASWIGFSVLNSLDQRSNLSLRRIVRLPGPYELAQLRALGPRT